MISLASKYRRHSDFLIFYGIYLVGTGMVRNEPLVPSYLMVL